MATPTQVASSTISTEQKGVVEKAIADARKAIVILLDTEPSLRPHCIRIAFYDALSYDPISKLDGPNGSIRTWEGLDNMKGTLEKLDNLAAPNVPWSLYVSHADLYQLAGIEAVKKARGPTVDFQPGRMDSFIPIPTSKIPVINQDTSASSIKATFYRIGFTDKEIVALSSAYYYWMNYSQQPDVLSINNSYYKKLLEIHKAVQPEASTTSTTATSTTPSLGKQQSNNTTSTQVSYIKCLLSDASFRKHVELFSENEDAFTKEYSNAHKKLSSLGFKHFPEPILTETEQQDIKHGIAFAVAMTILFGFVGFFYEVMRT